MRLDYRQKEQLYRRAVFNAMTINQDDHTKIISFLMDQTGTWRLSPAYDLTYSYHPENRRLNRHQMLINGKAEEFNHADMIALAQRAGLKNGLDVMEQVRAAISEWHIFADKAELTKTKTRQIHNEFRIL